MKNFDRLLSALWATPALFISPLLTAIEPSGYHLVTSDEFSGDTIDDQVWTYRTGAAGYSVQEADNVYASRGKAVIELREEQAIDKGGRYIEFEAETGSLNQPMQLVTFNGEDGIYTPNGGGSGGYADYTFNVTTAGDYEVVLYVNGPSANDDSFRYQIDGGTIHNATGLFTASNWEWKEQNVTFSLSSGPHTIRILQLEDGTYLGKVMLKDPKKEFKDYTGGGLITKQAFRYGYYETRAKLWGDQGWHPAFWTAISNGGAMDFTSEDPRIEIDILENDTINPNRYEYVLHRWGPPGKAGSGAALGGLPDLSADFYIWGAEFLPETVRFYFNDVYRGELDVSSYAHNDQHVYLSCIAKTISNPDQTVDTTNLPGDIQFDYFRFYSKQDIIPSEYEFINKASGKVLRTKDLEIINSPEVLQYTDESLGRNQMWQALDAGSGEYRLRNSFSSLSLERTVSTTPPSGRANATKDVRILTGANNQGPTFDLAVGPLGNGKEFRTIIEFDLAELSFTPATVELEFIKVSDGRSVSNTQTFEVYELTRDFVEDQAKWTEAETGASWTTAGGDYSPTRLSSLTFDPVSIPSGDKITFPTSANFASAVSTALVGDKKLRLMILSDEGSNSSVRSMFFMRSSEDDIDEWPELRVSALLGTADSDTDIATGDVRIRTSQPNSNFEGNDIVVGPLSDTDSFRSLLEFDVSGLSFTPVTADLSLTVSFQESGTLSNSYVQGLEIFTVSDFDPATATWTESSTGNAWITPGGDFSGGALGHVELNAQDVAGGPVVTFGTTDALLTAVNDAIAGDGVLRLLLKSDEEGNALRSLLWFHSAEDFGEEPTLTLTNGQGARAILTASANDTGDTNMRWDLVDLNNGCYGIKHVDSGQFLRVNTTANNETVKFHTTDKPDEQASWILKHANPLERYIPGSAALPQDWYYTWLGYLYEDDDEFPWVYHRDHGWIYLAGTGGDKAWIYDPTLGWLWTTPEHFPYAYDLANATWLYYEVDASGNTRQYFNFETGNWTSPGALAETPIDMVPAIENIDYSAFISPSTSAPADPSSIPTEVDSGFSRNLPGESTRDLTLFPGFDLSSLRLVVRGLADKQYTLESTTSLQAPITWTPYAEADGLSEGTTVFEVPMDEDAQFFRYIESD